MQRMKIILADPDNVYVDRVADYINTEYSSRVKLVVCTRLNLLEHYLDNSFDEFDFLLVHPDFYTPGSPLYKNIKFIIQLTDDLNCTCPEKSGNYLYKYQPGDKMVNELLRFYSEKTERLPGSSGGIRNTKIISVFSPAGGVGKTSIALALAASLSKRQMEVLFLGMESFNSVPSILELNGRDGFTKVLLTLHENPQLISVRVEMNKTKENNFSFHILEPPECFLELTELEEEQFELLLAKIKQACKYDVVVIDTDSSFGNNLITLLDNSDKAVMVGTFEEPCRYKIEAFTNQLRMLEAEETKSILNKTVLLINKVEGNASLDIPGPELANSCKVPYVANLWTSGSRSKLKFDPNQELADNLKKLTQILGCGD